MSTLADIRKEYTLKTLSEDDVDSDPFLQFNHWWDDAIKSELEEINAMTLATATIDGVPSARIVLLKEVTKEGFVFFTNYQSNKGKELLDNPKACLVFFWAPLERQIRIVGTVEKISEEESTEYFSSRPVDSRIGAWSSPQSNIIASREIIEENVIKYQQQFADGNIPRPANWGGYIVKPTKIEFWQGRPSRLHDRIQYTLEANGGWKIVRLAP